MRSLPKHALQKDAVYVLGVSGGVDSMVLLDLVSRQIPTSHLLVAHFNHKTRGTASDRDEDFVRSYCKKKGLCFFRGERKGQAVSEAALREERHRFFRQVARKQKAQAILLAHHLDDQIETFFLRLLRGAHLKGLGGMRKKQGLLLRPLLHVPQSSIEKYAKLNKIPFREDASNASPIYFRNRLRHALIPVFSHLSQQYGGPEKVALRLAKTMGEIHQTESYLNSLVGEKIQAVLVDTPFFLRLSLADYQQFPGALQGRVLHHLLKRVGAKSPDSATLLRLKKFLKKPRREIHLCEGISVQESLGQIYFLNSLHRARQRERLPLKRKVRGQITHLWNAELQLALALKLESSTQEVRFFREGDRIEGKKLKEVFLENRLPRLERRFVPLLAKKNSSTVLWCFPAKHALVKKVQCEFPFSLKKN